jgi:hypothetical protein
MRCGVNMRSFAIRTLCAGLGAVALWAGPSALAGEIRINGGDCAPAVHLTARDAPLSDVLKRLAKSLDFQLSFESDSDPLVSIDTVRPPIDLLSRLAPLENVSIAKAQNPRCPQRERIVKIWVLPKGQGSVVRTAMTPPNGRQVPEADEQARRAQAGADMILNAHGIPTTAGGPAESN